MAVALGMVAADGKPDTSIHDLRRTCATNWAALGISEALIDRMQGRSSKGGDSGVTWIYNRHTYLNERRQALEKWEVHLLRIVSQP